MAELDIQEAVAVRPGDTLVVRFRPDISLKEFDAAREQFMERIPEGVQVLFVNAEELVVLRGGNG